MPSAFQRNALFVGASVAAGIVIAVLILRMWPHTVLGSGVAVVRPPPPTDTTRIPAPPAPEAILTSDHEDLRQAPAGVREDDSAVINERTPAAITQDSFAPAVRAAAPAVVSVYVQRTERLPWLFALDADLAIPDGFHYSRDCGARPGTVASDGGFCVSHFGCSSAGGCGGDSSSSGDGGDSGSGGCGGGCGGGGD